MPLKRAPERAARISGAHQCAAPHPEIKAAPPMTCTSIPPNTPRSTRSATDGADRPRSVPARDGSGGARGCADGSGAEPAGPGTTAPTGGAHTRRGQTPPGHHAVGPHVPGFGERRGHIGVGRSPDTGGGRAGSGAGVRPCSAVPCRGAWTDPVRPARRPSVRDPCRSTASVRRGPAAMYRAGSPNRRAYRPALDAERRGVVAPPPVDTGLSRSARSRKGTGAR